MDAPDLGPIDEYIPIPKEFWSFAGDSPFEHCMVCNKTLQEDGSLYLIEKAYKKSEVVFEYAICIDCHLNLRKELSQQSLRLIDHFFDEHVDLVKRRKGLIESYDEEISPWLSHCLITGKPASECEEYQIMTLCDGEDLLFTYIPCLISGKAMEAIQGILSKKTRDRLDGFVEEFLGLPPEAKNPTPYIG
jgi:hypothetical protein